MATLIIHPGSPKTATTCIQSALDKNKRAIAALPERTRVLSINDFRGHEILKTFLQYYRDHTQTIDMRVVNDFFRGMDDMYDKVIISEETFCHDFMPSKKFSQGGIDKTQKTIDFINSIPLEKKKVVLTIKKQTSLLVSTYTHFLHRHRETRSFSNWIENEVNHTRLSWLKAVDTFDEAFGHENVVVVPLEMSKLQGISGYVDAVFKGFDLDPTNYDTEIVDFHNPSPSRRAVELILKMNNEIKRPDKAASVNDALIRHFPVSEFGKFSPNHEILDLVHNQYSDENQILAKRKFEDLCEIFR